MTRYFRLMSVVLASSYFWYYAQTYTEWHFIDNVNLIFHEAGHAIFFWLPEFWNIAAGSIFQASLPLIFALYFFLHGQKISAAFCLLWLGQNLLNISVYAGDAIEMQLDLLGGDAVIHDWNYLFIKLGVLQHAGSIAGSIHAAGIVALFFGTVFAIYSAWTSRSIDERQVI